jgi:type I restriction enzyme S subunit
MEDLGIDQKFFVPTQTKPLTEVAGSYTYFANGDVLLAKITPCFENGKLGIAADLTNGIGFGSSEYIVFRPDAAVDKEWLYYFLSQPGFRAEGAERMSGAVGHKRVAKDFIEGYPIPVPPLPEQRRIVGILDEAFEGIATAKANAEKNLQNARALFDSHLNSVFTKRGPGWVDRRLGDVFEIGSSKRIMETEWTSAGVPFYGGKEIVKLAKFGSTISNAYISEKKYRDYSSKYDMPRPGDILITARGTIGVGYVVQEGDRFYYKDGNIISMRGREATNPHFVLYAFRSKVMADQFGDLSGTTVRHLPIEKAKELVLRMPEFADQNAAVAGIRDIEAETQQLASIYQQKLAALDELKKSLLHQAFSGEL